MVKPDRMPFTSRASVLRFVVGADRGVEAEGPTDRVEESLDAGLFSHGPPECVGIEVVRLQVSGDTVALEQQAWGGGSCLR